MAELKINLLGPPEILWENERLAINRRIPRTLVYFLASHNRFIGRGELISTFWADTSPQIARRRLREALSRIRANIPIKNFIAIDNDLVGLDQTNIIVDLKEFQALQNAIGSKPWIIPADQVLPEEILNSIKNAINLWRGSKFLEGTKLPVSTILDDWRYHTNLSLTQSNIRLLIRLSDHYLAAGQIEDGLVYSKLAVESDPFDENLHYRVLKILADSGRYQEARQYYISITEMLRDELDIRPSQQMVSIYRQIQRKTHTSSAVPKSNWRILASIQTPFIGREQELKKLHNSMEKGNAVLILGESGSGKTRLVQEFYDIFAPGKRIIATNCHPAEINLPFQPFSELLRNYISTHEWENYPDTWAESLSTILPEIHPRRVAQVQPASPDLNRSSLFEAIRQVFLLICQQRDLILFIDDLQWADEETLATIAYLSERAPFTKNAFLVLGSRSEETNPNFNHLILSNHTASNITRIELGRLNSQEISSLGRYVFGYPLDEDLVEQLTFDTGGNPFIVLETLRSLRRTETLSGLTGLSGNPKLPLANSVYLLVKGRLEQLSPSAREICEYAAVIGKEFDPGLISEANQKSLSITARAIEELKQRNIIEPVYLPNQVTNWRFVHEKIRESIIYDTNQIRLRLLHKRIARTLESKIDSKSKQQSAVLARHYEYAGNLSTAFSYWLQAAQWARQLFSSREALRILEHAEKIILNSNEPISEDLIHDLYIEWNELGNENQDAELIRKHNKRLLSFGQARQSRLLIGTAYNGLSIACLVNNQFEEGLAYSNQAIRYLASTNHAYEVMNSHTNRGVYLYMLGRLNEAIESFELALEMGGSEDNPSIQRGLANAHYQHALCQTLAGWPELGLKSAKTSLEFANTIGHHHIAVTAYLASSLAQYFLTDFSKSRWDIEAGIEIAKKLQANRMLGYLFTTKTFLELAEGKLGSAYELSQAIHEIGEQNNHQDLLSLAFRIKGDIYLSLQAYDKALHEFHRGSEFGSRDFWGLDNLIRIGYSQIKTGMIETGMLNLHRGIDLAQAAGFGMVEIRGLQFLSFAHASNQEWHLTEQIADQLDHLAHTRGLNLVGILAKYIGGQAKLTQKNPEEDINQLDYLLRMLGDKDHPYIMLRILIQQVQLKQRTKLPADQEVKRIYEILERCEKYAYPRNIKSAFLKYKREVEKMIAV